jgi:hypothetical protein
LWILVDGPEPGSNPEGVRLWAGIPLFWQHGISRKITMTDNGQLEQEVDALADLIWDVASRVWEYAELGYKE